MACRTRSPRVERRASSICPSRWTTHAHEPMGRRTEVEEAADILLSLVAASSEEGNELRNPNDYVDRTDLADSNKLGRIRQSENTETSTIKDVHKSASPTVQLNSTRQSRMRTRPNISTTATAAAGSSSSISSLDASSSPNDKGYKRASEETNKTLKERKKRKNDRQNERRAEQAAGTFQKSSEWDQYTEEEIRLLARILRHQIDRNLRATDKEMGKLFRESRPKGSKERTASAISSFVHRHADLRALRNAMRARR